MEVKVVSHKDDVLKELDEATEKVLFAMGLLGVEGCVEKASEIDSVTIAGATATKNITLK